VPGEAAPQLVVRDDDEAELAAGGQATLSTQRSWWYPGPEPELDAPVVQTGPWVDDTPGQAVGSATVLGDLYAYDADHLQRFSWRHAFKLGVVSDCE
jgi:hypothetical protein